MKRKELIGQTKFFREPPRYHSLNPDIRRGLGRETFPERYPDVDNIISSLGRHYHGMPAKGNDNARAFNFGRNLAIALVIAGAVGGLVYAEDAHSPNAEYPLDDRAALDQVKPVVAVIGNVAKPVPEDHIEEDKTTRPDKKALSDKITALEKEGYEIWHNVTVTSYQNLDERFFNGIAKPAYDYRGMLLDFYKSDFLEQLKIDGSGIGVDNPGKYLCYDFDRSKPGKEVYYYTDRPQGAHGDELIPWTGDEPSVAVNPRVPHKTQIKFIDLGPDAKYNCNETNNILANKTFTAEDNFSNWPQDYKKIDVYVGMQKAPIDNSPIPQTFMMKDVIIALKYPKESS